MGPMGSGCWPWVLAGASTGCLPVEISAPVPALPLQPPAAASPLWWLPLTGSVPATRRAAPAKLKNNKTPRRPTDRHTRNKEKRENKRQTARSLQSMHEQHHHRHFTETVLSFSLSSFVVFVDAVGAARLWLSRSFASS